MSVFFNRPSLLSKKKSIWRHLFWHFNPPPPQNLKKEWISRPSPSHQDEYSAKFKRKVNLQNTDFVEWHLHLPHPNVRLFSILSLPLHNFFLTLLAGDVFELGPRSESRNSLNFDRRQPQQQQSRRPYTGRSNFVWPFHKSGSLETTTTTTTRRRLPLNERSSNNSSTSTTARAPKIRVVGRGGSGSKLRQVSLSNPAVVVLESESTSCLRQPHDQDSLFYRPTGRGGLGSRRSTGTSPPSAMKPLKPPTAILDLIRGRKRSDAQLNERFKIHNKSSPPRRSQSLYYRPQKDSFTRIVTRTGTVIFFFCFEWSFFLFFFNLIFFKIQVQTPWTTLLGALYWKLKDTAALPFHITYIIPMMITTIPIHISKKKSIGQLTNIANVAWTSLPEPLALIHRPYWKVHPKARYSTTSRRRPGVVVILVGL